MKGIIELNTPLTFTVKTVQNANLARYIVGIRPLGSLLVKEI